MKNSQDRKVFEGWNNLSQFEIEQLQILKDEMLNDEARFKEIYPAQGYPDRELIRFLQAYEYNQKKTLNALEGHFKWRISSLPCKLTSNAIKLLVNYIFNCFNLEYRVRLYPWKRQKIQTHVYS